jgi:hypothetical protein
VSDFVFKFECSVCGTPMQFEDANLLRMATRNGYRHADTILTSSTEPLPHIGRFSEEDKVRALVYLGEYVAQPVIHTNWTDFDKDLLKQMAVALE